MTSYWTTTTTYGDIPIIYVYKKTTTKEKAAPILIKR
mgnify:CR=1 FL=1